MALRNSNAARCTSGSALSNNSMISLCSSVSPSSLVAGCSFISVSPLRYSGVVPNASAHLFMYSDGIFIFLFFESVIYCRRCPTNEHKKVFVMPLAFRKFSNLSKRIKNSFQKI
nr:MAG TPA: hypothetical protein [Caudoviricetes sp.]